MAETEPPAPDAGPQPAVPASSSYRPVPVRAPSAPSGMAHRTLADHAADPPVFDPHAPAHDFSEWVASGDPMSVRSAPSGFRPAEAMPSDGPYDPATFQDGAVVDAPGRHPFAVGRELLTAALETAASMAAKSKERPPILRAVLLGDRVKIAAVGERGGFVEALLPLEEAATTLAPDARPKAFFVELPKILAVARSGVDDQVVRFELDAARRRLLVRGQRAYARLATRGPDDFTDYHRDAGVPTEVGPVDPAQLREGLALAGQFVQVDRRYGAPRYWSWASIRDGMVLGGQPGAFAVTGADGLVGMEAEVHAADIAPLVGLLRRFDPRETRNFETNRHRLVADGRLCVGLPKADAAFPAQMYRPLLGEAPGCSTLAPRQYVVTRLERIAASVKGEPGGDVIRLRLKGVGADARLIFQAWDAPNRNRGLAVISCRRTPLGDDAVPADVDTMVALEHLRRAISHIDTPNLEFSVLPPSSGGLRLPRLCFSHTSEVGGLWSRVFIAPRVLR